VSVPRSEIIVSGSGGAAVREAAAEDCAGDCPDFGGLFVADAELEGELEGEADGDCVADAVKEAAPCDTRPGVLAWAAATVCSFFGLCPETSTAVATSAPTAQVPSTPPPTISRLRRRPSAWCRSASAAQSGSAAGDQPGAVVGG
jgi:hypothetical protein